MTNLERIQSAIESSENLEEYELILSKNKITIKEYDYFLQCELDELSTICAENGASYNIIPHEGYLCVNIEIK